MLKAEGIDVVAIGDVAADPWTRGTPTTSTTRGGRSASPSGPTPSNGSYVKLVTLGGRASWCSSASACRAAAACLHRSTSCGAELPAHRSVLLRFDGPDYYAGCSTAMSSLRVPTVCWCNGVTVWGTSPDSAVVRQHDRRPASARTPGRAPDAAAARVASPKSSPAPRRPMARRHSRPDRRGGGSLGQRPRRSAR